MNLSYQARVSRSALASAGWYGGLALVVLGLAALAVAAILWAIGEDRVGQLISQVTGDRRVYYDGFTALLAIPAVASIVVGVLSTVLAHGFGHLWLAVGATSLTARIGWAKAEVPLAAIEAARAIEARTWPWAPGDAPPLAYVVPGVARAVWIAWREGERRGSLIVSASDPEALVEALTGARSALATPFRDGGVSSEPARVAWSFRTYLRGAELLTRTRNWWHVPAILTLIHTVIWAISAATCFGPLLAPLDLLMSVWLLGWVAAVQRTATAPGHELPRIDVGGYLSEGFRLWATMFVWSVPAVLLGITVGAIELGYVLATPDADHGWVYAAAAELEVQSFAATLSAIGTMLQVITVVLALIGPLLNLAMTRTALSGGMTGVRPSQVLPILRAVPKEAYLGGLLWLLVGGAAHLAGVCAAGVGFFFGQAWWFAAFGIFWVDIDRLARWRGVEVASSARAQAFYSASGVATSSAMPVT
ncbi:MAG: hypothetical protein AB7S26_10490 [Sandaracinaceae bacterium]